MRDNQTNKTQQENKQHVTQTTTNQKQQIHKKNSNLNPKHQNSKQIQTIQIFQNSKIRIIIMTYF